MAISPTCALVVPDKPAPRIVRHMPCIDYGRGNVHCYRDAFAMTAVPDLPQILTRIRRATRMGAHVRSAPVLLHPNAAPSPITTRLPRPDFC